MSKKETENHFLPASGKEYALDHIRLNAFYHRIILSNGYPRVVEDGWLDRVITTKGSIDLSMHIVPTNISFMLTALNRELVKQKSDLISAKTKGVMNPSLAIQQSDTLSTLVKLQSGKERLFDLSLAINCRARSKTELDYLSSQVESHLQSMMIIPQKPLFQMLSALKQLIPLLSRPNFPSRNMPSSVLSACFPFTTRYLEKNTKGVLAGVQLLNRVPLFLDFFGYPNHNGVIMGSSGSGKSFFVKLMVIRNVMSGVKTVIIDPQNEYTTLTRSLGGKTLQVESHESCCLNPFDLSGQSLADKLDALEAFFILLVGNISNEQQRQLRSFLHEFYSTHSKKSPNVSHFHSLVKKHLEKNANSNLASVLNEIQNRLMSETDLPPAIDWSAPIVSFNLAGLSNRLRPAYMFLILDLVRNQFPNNKENRLLVMDEAWSMLSHDAPSEIIFEMIKTARKFKWGVMLITQEANDLLHNPAGKSVLANTSWKMLFRQESSVIKNMSEQFHLIEAHEHFLLTAQTGEGLLITPRERLPIQVIFSDLEKQWITSSVLP